MVGLRASGSWVGGHPAASSVATWWRAWALLAFTACSSSLVECHQAIFIHVNMYDQFDIDSFSPLYSDRSSDIAHWLDQREKGWEHRHQSNPGRGWKQPYRNRR